MAIGHSGRLGWIRGSTVDCRGKEGVSLGGLCGSSLEWMRVRGKRTRGSNLRLRRPSRAADSIGPPRKGEPEKSMRKIIREFVFHASKGDLFPLP